MNRTKPQHMEPNTARIVAISLSMLLPGCMLGPDYQAPSPELPNAWRQAGHSAPAAAAADDPRWWQTFDDPVLSRLIVMAQTGNRDLKQAAARVEEAKARRELAFANLLPTSSLTTSVNQTGSAKAAGISAGSTGIGRTFEHYSHTLSASWELDLFGKLRRSLEAAEATEQAAQEDLYAVLVSLYAEVAQTYIELRGYQERLTITETNLATQTDTYEITQWRQMAGLSTQLDVEQAKVTLENTRASLPSLRSSLQQAKHNLAKLTGQAPDALYQLLARPAPIPVANRDIALGIPADLLRQRPDVRQAERKLAAQTAQIGVAEAANYPDFTLSGSIGLDSLAFANLYTASAKAFQMAAKSALVLLDGGRIRANVAIQSALQQQALGFYEQTLLTALSEVENGLIAYREESQRQDALKVAVEAGDNALAIAKLQYQAGTSDFQAVLETQRALLNNQLQLAQSRADLASYLVQVYKALGGGWQTRITPPTGEQEDHERS
ncbi:MULTISPECIES: efflux transporter outer membrane subunit [Methylomonas]|uniref:efflux transporter outer membrane subunit n=1 Tax=Methylomonas TaxID=416 RepID=UPI001E530018|nr:efflux transporter outer membrane subunit [Methylomonas rhizoryzae]